MVNGTSFSGGPTTTMPLAYQFSQYRFCFFVLPCFRATSFQGEIILWDRLSNRALSQDELLILFFSTALINFPVLSENRRSLGYGFTCGIRQLLTSCEHVHLQNIQGGTGNQVGATRSEAGSIAGKSGLWKPLVLP